MQVPDLFALDCVNEAVTFDNIPLGKPCYFKLVFFKISGKIIKEDNKLRSFVKKNLKEFPFISGMRQLECLENTFELKDKQHFNVMEYIVKVKTPNKWYNPHLFNEFCKIIKEKEYPNSWMLSDIFCNVHDLKPKLCDAFDIVEDASNTIRCTSDIVDVENMFKKTETKKVVKEVSSENLKDFYERIESSYSCWNNIKIDNSILFKNLNDIKEFEGIYGIDAQTKMILTSIVAAKESNGKRKAHSVLFGPAGCGKTTILDRLDELLGKQFVLRLDAPCMTKSGLETLLLEMKDIPPILIIEEIEKSSENNLRTLLGMMDERSEICKTTVSGSITRPVDCLIFSTVNDIEKFNKFLDGALSSRFKNKVFFPRPSKKVLEMILERDIKKHGGKLEWIKPALDFAEELNISDPRMILSFLINGDRLLDGSFQEDYRTMEKLKQEAGYGSN